MSGMFPDSGVPPTDANNSLPNPDTVNCPDELWYSTSRCTPRFDPAAANAVLSELINLVNCGGTPYDCTKLNNLCSATKDLIIDQIFSCLPDRFVNVNATCSNEFLILQRDTANNCVKFAKTNDVCSIINDLIEDMLFGCLPQNFPLLGKACTVEQLAVSVDANGCRRISRFTAASARIGSYGNNTAYPPNTVKTIPADPNNTATFYTYSELRDDYLAGTVNEAKITPNIVAKGTFTLDCDTPIAFKWNCSNIFAPKDNNGDGTRSYFMCRVDKKFIVSGSNNLHPTGCDVNNFSSNSEINSGPYVYGAGTHTIEFFMVARTVPCTQATINTTAGTTSQSFVLSRGG